MDLFEEAGVNVVHSVIVTGVTNKQKKKLFIIYIVTVKLKHCLLLQNVKAHFTKTWPLNLLMLQLWHS